MSAVELAELGTVSVLERARAGGAAPLARVDLGPGEPALEVVRAVDVLYVPSALLPGQSLQVLDGRCLPFEAVFDTFTAGFVRDWLAARGVTRFTGFEPAAEAGDVCILGNVFSRNFTHWHEELMKVVVLERAGVECRYVLADLPGFARELLALLGVAAERVVECSRPTRFRSALYTTPVSYRNVADHPGVLWALREALLAVDLAGQPELGPRLWLERGAQTRLGRALVNGEEVHACLERHGFARVDMGALPLEAQIAAARSMEVLAGLHGSQFVHSQLMAPRSRVVECFSPLYLNPTYTEIYRVFGHRYSQLTATHTPVFPYPHGGDVLVDLQQLELALQDLP